MCHIRNAPSAITDKECICSWRDDIYDGIHPEGLGRYWFENGKTRASQSCTSSFLWSPVSRQHQAAPSPPEHIVRRAVVTATTHPHRATLFGGENQTGRP